MVTGAGVRKMWRDVETQIFTCARHVNSGDTLYSSTTGSVMYCILEFD